GQSWFPGREPIAGRGPSAVPLQPAGAALYHGISSAALRLLFVQSGMGLCLVLERQGIRAAHFDVSVASGADPKQWARSVWLAVAVFFELRPVVVFLPAHAAGNAFVLGADDSRGVIL